MKKIMPVIIFNVLYLTLASVSFLQSSNIEFVIYVLVIAAILSGIFFTLSYTRFPAWMLWLFSIWGLMHVLGGSVQTPDGVLFAYRLFPFLDNGGEFYILKYDQVVHFYLYGLVAAMAYHILRNVLQVRGHAISVFLFAVLASLGISALNEIMEFFIAINMQSGVGGYENTMLDLCFNFAGAVLGASFYSGFCNKRVNIAYKNLI